MKRIRGILRMTKLLFRLFIREGNDGAETASRAEYGRLAGMVGIACNVLLFALKFLIGTLSAGTKRSRM